MRRARFIPLFFCVAVAPVAGAQWQATGEVGLARIEQTAIPTANAQTFGATVDGVWTRALLRSSFLASRVSTERWTGQGVVLGSLGGSFSPWLRWEMSGALTAFAQTNAQTASSKEALGRLSLGDARRGVALGVGGGVRKADAGTEPVGRASLGGWISVRDEQFAVELAGVTTTTSVITGISRAGLSYADAAASWRHARGAFSAGASAGARVANISLVPDGGWLSLDAGVQATSRMAVVAAFGRSPQDVVRGVPATTYASLTLRVSTVSRPALVRPRARVVQGPSLVATREHIELRIDNAERVELMADFTNWSPVALELRAGVWRLERAMTPGLHRLMIRINGGEWTTPANLPVATDDLGGKVGLVSVP
jgi:hypothetical protein